MDSYLGSAWVLMIVLKALWILVVPIIITIAACTLWNSAPRWISVAFLVSAVFGIVAALPQFLMMFHGLSPEQYGKIALPLFVTSGIVRIFAAVALLALAIRMQAMTQHGGGPPRLRRSSEPPAFD